MKLSDLSINRPVLATVMSLLIAVAGAVSFLMLPVREYPDVDRPVVSVTTVYPGASPETVEATLTEPLEQVMNGIDGIRAVESVSSFGRSTVEIEFVSGRDIDLATMDVSNAIQRAVGDLPENAERPVVAKTGANARPIMWLSLRGEDYAPVDLTDLADRVVKNPLQVLPGVARVLIGGERRYAMRVWLDPAEMAARGVGADDVQRAIRENNLTTSAGELEGTARKFTVEADALVDDPRVYERMVIREDGDTRVRIGDVGWVELGSEDYETITRYRSTPVVGLGIVRQSRANQLAVSRAVREALPRVREALPEGVDIVVAVDDTRFVEASLREVARTLAIALSLVVIVNLVFLRSRTTTAIAAVAIPISLVGTFAAIQALGFSINVLTLLALVLAIGLLVDDAIVVMENVYRRQELGEGRLLAARNGAREVGFPVLATTVAVVAVLIPLSLMTAHTGRLFREFALSMATAVSISTFVALTLVPMLCSRYLRVRTREGRVSRAIGGALGAAGEGYRRALETALAHPAVTGVFLAAVAAALIVTYRVLPSTLAPVEDRGSIFTLLRAPEGSTAAYTDRAMREVEARYRKIPEVAGYFSAIALPIGGPPNTATGVVFARLKPWGERDRKQQAIVAEVQPDFAQIPEALVFAINPPSLGQRSTSDIEVVLTSAGADLEELEGIVQSVLPRVREVPGVVNVDTDLRLDDPQLEILFDRERASDVGVPVRAVSEALRLLVAQGPADEFVLRNKEYDVVTALAAPFRAAPGQLGDIHLRARDGSMVPLASLVELVPAIGPARLNHYGLQRSAKVTASLGPGATLGETLPRVRGIVQDALPGGYTTELGGLSREFVESAGQIYVTFGVALVVIFLVLSAQFESFLHPITVMGSVPLAAAGALLSLAASGNTLNLFSQIGIILLVGIVTKNSILLVDFANQERARGTELLDALRAAGRARFRPILMTSTTSIFGAMPLALATGAGAESRQAIGVAVVGGLVFSTVFTLVVIPVIHYALIRAAERLGFNTIPPRVELLGEEGGASAPPR